LAIPFIAYAQNQGTVIEEYQYATPYMDMMAVTAPKDLDEASARSKGTCNGAYWSGVRATREVAEVLN
jgi:hypothetical protein